MEAGSSRPCLFTLPEAVILTVGNLSFLESGKMIDFDKDPIVPRADLKKSP
jgi:hypothetical protein